MVKVGLLVRSRPSAPAGSRDGRAVGSVGEAVDMRHNVVYGHVHISVAGIVSNACTIITQIAFGIGARAAVKIHPRAESQASQILSLLLLYRDDFQKCLYGRRLLP